MEEARMKIVPRLVQEACTLRQFPEPATTASGNATLREKIRAGGDTA
jgi:hypothetical protein